MKKLISLLLALVMLLSLGVTAFAIEKDPETGELYETFIFEDYHLDPSVVNRSGIGATISGDIFTIKGNYVDANGYVLYGGSKNIYIRITPNEGKNVTITRIEARLFDDGWFGDIGISSGVKNPNSGLVAAGTMVEVQKVNSQEFAFEGGLAFCYFDLIKVYYTCNEHIWNEDNHCEVCDITKCEYEGHSYDKNNTCINCGVTKCEVEGHNYDENNTCINCGMTKCEIEGHIYENGVCTRCRHECENEFHNGVYACPDCGMEFDPTQGNPLISGSTISDGSLTIICTIAAAAVFGISGYLLGKKKKVKTEE